MAQFPEFVQAALLFDRLQPLAIDTVVREFLAAGQRIDVPFNTVEAVPGTFYRLYGMGVMVTVEYLPKPAHAPAFEVALGSPFTQITHPEARDTIARHRSHVLVGVTHGAMQLPPEMAAMLAGMGVYGGAAAGQTLDQYKIRQSVCATMARLVQMAGRASLVHWTTSDHLLSGKTFEALSTEAIPSLLHVHPILSGAGRSADGRDQATLATFGAAPFIGREIHVVASPVPWHESLRIALVFLKVATTEKGYIVPDGDTFADEDQTISCGVRHVPEGSKSDDLAGPLYRLEILHCRKHAYVSPSYAAPRRVFDDRSVPPDVLEGLADDREAALSGWRAGREMVEGIGGRFQVREVQPPRNGPGFQRVFGRKKPSGG